MKATIDLKRSLLALLPIVALLFMNFLINNQPQTGNDDEILTTKAQLLKTGGVDFSPEDSEFSSAFRVVSFTVSTRIGEYEESYEQKGSPRFTKKQIALIKRAKNGSKVYIENIKAIGPGGEIRNLGSIVFKLKG